MRDLLAVLNSGGVRYLLVGGQAMRLYGMPRFSMDWDFFIPPRDEENLKRLNEILQDELDLPIVPLGARGENFIPDPVGSSAIPPWLARGSAVRRGGNKFGRSQFRGRNASQMSFWP